MADARRSMISPPVLARRWAVSASKILSWIHSGQLRALNVATSLGGRPRYRISEGDIADFERRRVAVPEGVARRPNRQRRDPDIIRFF
jgi:hypothetical protein